MLNRIFPKQLDNNYRGRWLAIWIFGAIMFAKAGQGVETIVKTRETATGPDGTSLDGLTAAGVDTVLQLFAVLGLYTLVLPLIGVVVLIRYRAMIPFMYVMLLILYVSNRVLHDVHPSFAGETQSYGVYINLTIFAVTVLGFVLSLTNRAASPQATNAV